MGDATFLDVVEFVVFVGSIAAAIFHFVQSGKLSEQGYSREVGVTKSILYISGIMLFVTYLICQMRNKFFVFILVAVVILIFVYIVKSFEAALKNNPYTSEGKPITDEVRKKLVLMAWVSPVVAIVMLVLFIWILDVIKQMLKRKDK